VIAPALVKRTTDRRAARSVAGQVGRFEARRFLRHPLPWIGVLAGFWMMWSAFGTTAPVWRRDSVYLAGAMLPLSALVFLWFNHLQIRERQLAEVLDALPTSPADRLRGIQLGLVGPTGLAVAASAIGLAYLAVGQPVGTIPWWEVVAGPLMVAALGMLGLALGRLLHHPVIAPIALAALAFFQLVAESNAAFSSGVPTRAVEWLAPWVPPETFEPVVIWDRRLAVGHGFFLIGAIILFATLPLLSRTRARWLIPLGVAAAGVGIFAYSSAMVPTGDVTRFEPLLIEQRCEERGRVNYCALDEFSQWIPRWQQTVRQVDTLIPVEIDWVVQRSGHFFFSEDAWSERLEGVVAYNEFEWDREGVTPNHALALALAAAEGSVGLPTRPQIRTYGTGNRFDCVP